MTLAPRIATSREIVADGIMIMVMRQKGIGCRMARDRPRVAGKIEHGLGMFIDEHPTGRESHLLERSFSEHRIRYFCGFLMDYYTEISYT
uniref:Transposase n=1 Tax=Steinernema glaseri TaxID=37863 RepID=A0A1I7ZJD9_9BILA